MLSMHVCVYVSPWFCLVCFLHYCPLGQLLILQPQPLWKANFDLSKYVVFPAFVLPWPPESMKTENCLPQCTSALTAFIYFPLLQFHMCTLHCSQISQTVLPGSVVSCLCGFHTCWFLYLEHHHHTHFIGLFYF